MANSIQYAKTISTPSEKLDTNELGGRIRVAFAEYEASAEQSTITMFTIPNGARILSGSVSYDALDVDEYKAAAASTSAQSVVSADTIALGKNSVVDANEDGLPVTVVLAGADGTGTIQLQMFYVID